jgi:hypothetical protein
VSCAFGSVYLISNFLGYTDVTSFWESLFDLMSELLDLVFVVVMITHNSSVLGEPQIFDLSFQVEVQWNHSQRAC